MPFLSALSLPFLRSIRSWSEHRVLHSLLIAAALGLAPQAQATVCTSAIVINPTTLPITNQVLVCGAGNDLNSTSVPGNLCVSNAGDYYKNGNEALYKFTPVAGTSGTYLISYTGQSWSSIIVYQGCPTVGGSICKTSVASSTSSKSLVVPLTAGVTYYIWFDTWPSPISPCPGTFSMNFVAPITNDDPCGIQTLKARPDEECRDYVTPGPPLLPPNSKDASFTSATATGLPGYAIPGPAVPCGGASPAKDVWFIFQAVGAAHRVTLSNIVGSNAAATNLVMAIYGPISGGTCPTVPLPTVPIPPYITCTNGNILDLTGLVVNSRYYIRVYHMTAQAASDYTFFNICITTRIPVTCGSRFYDENGPGANYSNNQATLATYCAPPGQVASFVFSDFNTEAADHLRIYNGPTIAYPILGDYTGTTLPPVLTTPPGGCFTFRFTSNASVTYSGWAGQMFCNPAPYGPGCTYALQLHDAGGDGWGAARVQVKVNGTQVGPNYGVQYSDNYILFHVNPGEVISLVYLADPSPAVNNQNTYKVSLLGQTVAYWQSAQPPVPGETWVQTASCSTPPNVPQDCLGGITLCSNANFVASAGDFGRYQDLSSLTISGCLTQEHQGVWYYFSPTTTGIIGLTLPAAAGDVDFAIWGPTLTAHCPTTAPLRCSWAATAGQPTGLGNGAMDVSEGASGDGWVAPITITSAEVGKVYTLYVDLWTSNSTQSLSASFTPLTTCDLSCYTLPIELVELEANPQGVVVNVDWATASEKNSDRFIVQHSADNLNFENIGQVAAAGNSQQRSQYRFTDTKPAQGWNYYRLQQIEMDGSASLSHVVTAEMKANETDKPLLYPNPVEDVLNVKWAGETDGVLLIVRDALGRTVTSGPPVNTYGASLQLSLNGITSGCYTLSIMLSNGQEISGGVFIKR